MLELEHGSSSREEFHFPSLVAPSPRVYISFVFVGGSDKELLAHAASNCLTPPLIWWHMLFLIGIQSAISCILCIIHICQTHLLSSVSMLSEQTSVSAPATVLPGWTAATPSLSHHQQMTFFTPPIQLLQQFSPSVAQLTHIWQSQLTPPTTSTQTLLVMISTLNSILGLPTQTFTTIWLLQVL